MEEMFIEHALPVMRVFLKNAHHWQNISMNSKSRDYPKDTNKSSLLKNICSQEGYIYKPNVLHN